MPEEQTEFTVRLVSAGAGKVGVIKAVRALIGLGMKEAQDFVNNLPRAVKTGIPGDEAKYLARALTDAGATVKML